MRRRVIWTHKPFCSAPQTARLRLVRFLYCDNGGIIRGKATHINGLARRMVEGIGQTLAMQAFRRRRPRSR